MSKSTRRAVRATATLAGMAALSATFVGTATAAEPDEQGTTDYSDGQYDDAPSTSDAGAPTVAKDMMDSESVGQPGFSNELVTFEMPTPDMHAAGQRNDGESFAKHSRGVQPR